MALALNDRVQQTGTANTTVSFTLSGSVTGFQSFAVVGNGNTTYYSATDATGNWEVGVGTYSTTGPTLTRTTILSSSTSGSAVTFSGSVNVFVTYPAEKSINYDGSGVATIGSVLSYSDTGIIGSFASTVAGYNQVIIQNKSTATNASSNLNVSNDASTSSAGYAELGINSSTFTGTGSFNIAGAAYVASASTDLAIGTYGAYNVHFVTNSNNTDAMTIFNSGGVSLGGQPDPGLGTLYANNVYLGFTTITAAAGTTVLTNSSSGWQQVVGTTTQTIQLPNATTLYKGLAYTIANNSTGAVTIKDNASTTLDTTVTGGSSILVLTNNSTSAGTWVAYSYIPSSYDFSTSTANFGNATITNALWNGTTIGTAYGGTGLTTFSASNYAIYSTSPSVLTAGTLPVAAGGTGASSASITAFNNITGYSAYGATGTTSTNLVFSTSPALTTPTISTSITLNTSAKLLGDFTNATVSSRSNFQTSTANSTTGIYALPSGTGSAASWQATNNSDPTNASKILIATNGSTDVQLVSGINGTGTYLPLSFYTNGTQQKQITTTGAWVLGTGTSNYGTSGQVLTSSGNGVPTWSTISGTTNVTNKTANYTLTTTDGSVFCNATGGAFTITLPTAVSAGGKIYSIKKTDSSTNAVVVGTTSSQTIDGNLTQSLAIQNAWITVQSDGANWQIIG